MRLRYSPSALADLDDILAYIAVRSPSGAQKVQARLQAITKLLLRHPNSGSRTDDPTIRRMTTLPYPYLIFYQATADEIIIHAVRHAARNPADMPGSNL